MVLISGPCIGNPTHTYYQAIALMLMSEIILLDVILVQVEKCEPKNPSKEPIKSRNDSEEDLFQGMDIVKETEETDKPATLQSALIDIRDLDLSVSSKIIFCYSVRFSRRSLFMAFISFNPDVFLRKTLLTKSFYQQIIK